METETSIRTRAATEQFRADVLHGLGLPQKAMLSRYFYDAEGDRIFQAIMAMPEYYLTRAEEEILRDHTAEVAGALVGDDQDPEVIELGAGDGTKTKHLLRHLLQEGKDPIYRPIDISANVLAELREALCVEMPDLRYQGVQGEYFTALGAAFKESDRVKAVLFLGSNIGNLKRDRAIELLSGVRRHLGPKDRFLVGFDLKKDPATIRAAYNDAKGHTRAFNLNLLHRINRELHADFDVDAFVHAPVYDPASGTAASYLVSTKDQVVTIPGADAPVRFKAWEAIHTEISQKYDRAMIDDLAKYAGLEVVASFKDSQELFTDVVFAAARPTVP